MRSTFARLATRARPATAARPAPPVPEYGAARAAVADADVGAADAGDALVEAPPVPAGPAPGRLGGVAVRLDAAIDAVAVLGAQLGLVEAAMRSAVADVDEEVAETFDFVLSRDRSRLRARLVLLGAAAVCGGATVPARPAVVTAAAAVELLHLGQRHHDTRHHDPRQAGDADVLVGDHLLARAVQLAIAVDGAAGEAVGRCIVARVRGQLIDDRERYCIDRLRGAYLESCRARTALLTGVAAALGARLAGGTRDQVDALQRYGEQLGLALQLADDLRDVVTDAADTGNDLRTGIYTLPTLAALHEAGELRAVLGRPLDRAALAHATQVVRRSGGVAVALSQIHRHIIEATASLDLLPAPAGLDELVHAIGHRAWHLTATQPVINLSP
jgi:heptaprenyl diphosphate synthase